MPVTVLSSRRNPKVMQAASLVRARHRRASGRHLAEGPHAVGAALRAGLVETVFATEGGHALLAGHLPGVDAHGRRPQVLTVTEPVLARIADAVTPQPVVAIVVTPAVDLDDLDGDRIVVFDAIADPGNVGTLIRTAHALGIEGVVVLEGAADPFGPKAVRASAGSVYGVPIAVASTDGLAAWATRSGRILIGLEARAAAPVETLRDLGGPCGLIIGSEAHGLSPALEPHLAGGVSIGMSDTVDSLNAATAGAIAMYVLAGRPPAAGTP